MRLDAAAQMLVALAVLRLAVIVFAHPMVGYANSYDFIREEACIGVWQHYAYADKAAAHPAAPVPALVFDGARRRDFCLPSADNLFAYAAAHVHKKGSTFDLREVGGLRAAATVLILATLLTQPIGAPLRLALAAAALLIFGDIATAAFANTLYVEYSVVLSVVATVGAIASLLTRPRPPGLTSILFACIATAWLCFTKQQYCPLGVLGAAAVGALLWRRWHKPRSATAILAIALGAAGLCLALGRGAPGSLPAAIQVANRADSVFGAILPEAADKAAALRTLGLPPTCQSAVGRDWYSQPAAQELCPKIAALRRWRLLPLFATQPGTFARPLRHAVFRSQPSPEGWLARYETPAAAAQSAVRLIRQTSISTLLAAIPSGLYCALLYASIACGSVVALRLPRGGMRADQTAAAALLISGSMIIAFAIASAVFGDGYFDLGRHTILIPAGLAIALCGATLGAATLMAGSRASNA